MKFIKKGDSSFRMFHSSLVESLEHRSAASRMARALGLSPSSIGSYKEGAVPALDRAAAIAAYLRKPLGEMLGENASQIGGDGVHLRKIAFDPKLKLLRAGKWLCTIHRDLLPPLKTENDRSLFMWRVADSSMHPILCDGEWTVVDPEKTEIHEELEPLLMVLEGKPCCRYVGLTTDGQVGVAMPNSQIRFPTTYTIKAFKAKAQVAGRILATVRWLAPDGIQPLPKPRRIKSRK